MLTGDILRMFIVKKSKDMELKLKDEGKHFPVYFLKTKIICHIIFRVGIKSITVRFNNHLENRFQ